MAGAAAITLLWVLARVRFDDRPVTPNPVAPVLSQLNAGANYEALASEVADLQGRLIAALALVEVPLETSTVERAPHRNAALRWRDDLALVLLPGQHDIERPPNLDVRAVDPATGFAVVRVPGDTATFASTSWTPRRMQQPRFFMSTTTTPAGASLRPAFVGSLVPIDGGAWPGTVWAVPSGAELEPGSFLFTIAGEFAGLVVASSNGLVVVPGATVIAEADRLVKAPSRPAGVIAVEVQPLTQSVAKLTGAERGVVVTWLRRDGPAWGTLVVGDVIEALDGHDLSSREQWDARVARLAAGESLGLRVRRRGEVRDVSIKAATVTANAGSGALGLALRSRTGVGAEVIRVQAASVAARAGLSAGDLITLFGDVRQPNPNQVARAFASLRPGDHVMAAVTRGDTHFVTVLGR